MYFSVRNLIVILFCNNIRRHWLSWIFLYKNKTCPWNLKKMKKWNMHRIFQELWHSYPLPTLDSQFVFKTCSRIICTPYSKHFFLRHFAIQINFISATIHTYWDNCYITNHVVHNQITTHLPFSSPDGRRGSHDEGGGLLRHQRPHRLPQRAGMKLSKLVEFVWM